MDISVFHKLFVAHTHTHTEREREREREREYTFNSLGGKRL